MSIRKITMAADKLTISKSQAKAGKVNRTEANIFNASNQHDDVGANEKPSKPPPGLDSQSQLKNGRRWLGLSRRISKVAEQIADKMLISKSQAKAGKVNRTETKQFNASNQQDFGADEKPSKPLPGLVSQSQLKHGQLSLKLGF